MLADRVRMGSYKPSLGASVTIKVEYINTPPTGVVIAFVPFVADPPEWEPFYSNIGYEGTYVTLVDYQAYTGTPISLMTAHTTPLVVNTMELTNPMIGFQIKGNFTTRTLSVNGVSIPSPNWFASVFGTPDLYGVFFLPTNLVEGDEVVLRLRHD